MRQRYQFEIPKSPTLDFETNIWSKGVKLVAGLDEAGRGALAGPVSVAVVILPPKLEVLQALPGVRDSKVMRPAQRLYWARRIKAVAECYGVGFSCAEEIDTGGIMAATRLAACRAVECLPVYPEHLLIDFIDIPELPIEQTSLVKGDARSLSIASASILAKTERDALLFQFDAQFPEFGFGKHKGYGTQAHRQALARFGPTPIHRNSFKLLG